MIFEISEDLDFSLDYYSYDIENIIDSDTQFVFDNFGNDPAVVVRFPSADPNDPGEVVRIFDSFQNIGDVETTGIDFDLGYKLMSDVGEFKFDFVMNYVLKYEEFRPGSDGNKRLNLKEGQFEQPEVRHTTSVNWNLEDIGVTLAINYIGEFEGDADSNFEDKTVDSMTTVDLVANYRGIDNTTLTIGATNLLNEKPPFSHHEFVGYVQSVHSGQGRFMYLKGTYRF
ncbi:MAG: iron complex outermembrane receptor protein [Glaciecola sp.]|jgi:iron complex outermembrane receptor protein